MMDGDIRTNTYDDGSSDALTGEQTIRNFNIAKGWHRPNTNRKCVIDQ